MKRTIGLIIIAALLGAGVWYGLKSQKKETLKSSTSTYAIDDPSAIHSIALIHRDGKKIFLERNKDAWIFNERYKANDRVVENLLEIIRKQRILYATSESMKPTMLKSLATNSLKVEIYGKDRQRLLTYYVGSVANDGVSTFFIQEDSDEPHMVGVPGFNGTVQAHYFRPDDDWKSLMVLESNPDDIQSIELEYPGMKNRSFRLTKQGSNFQITPFYDITPASSKPLLPMSISSYLSQFDKNGAEFRFSDNEKKDSLLNFTPFAILTVKTKTHEWNARYFGYLPYGVSHQDDLPPEDKDPNSPINTNRYYFILDEHEDFYLVQHRVLGRLLWAYQDFFEH